MAKIFLSEHSRRDCQVSAGEFNKRWNGIFDGDKKPITCSACGNPPYNGRLYGGLCRECKDHVKD